MSLRPLNRDDKGAKPRPINEHEKGKLRKEKEKADFYKRNTHRKWGDR